MTNHKKRVLVLGANGVVGRTLIEELKKASNYEIIAVARSYENTLIDGVFYARSDLISDNLETVFKDIDYCFLTVGLEYSSTVWERDWPVLMQNVATQALRSNAQLIFFDNVYSYGEPTSNITEKLSHNARTRKGKVRTQLIKILEELGEKGLDYVIAKSGEFYGENVYNSSIYNAFLENILANKSGFYLGDLSKKRSYTFVRDAVRGMIRLAEDESSYNQIWHLPTGEALTGNQYVSIIEEVLGKKVKVSAMSKNLARVMQIMIKPLREIIEMYYQFENDYVFSSDKFMAKYPDFKLTDYKTGFRMSIDSYKSKL